MTYSHLNGQIFKRDGTVYLVMEANDWSSDTLNVRTVDASKAICQMPREEIQRYVAERKKR
ncbi:MAG: hypothetical protein E2O54_06910 [Gammaproteobacteria bacterium]|nr:MAG: hypothetical protein E2O58_11695 [Gammaproteobacteria bacterium]TDJ40779.1 MAG: hypothetical protein E2O54_06910 [Gammaproteobacteria bacterium]